ncbi:BTAD domain-containing putative transcriptional regulator [Nonomuraea sp. NPDC050404]|uniref:AfsR/SARP family transcriptional regulator n=1 Tax=Nonomuraea sp. NPDC050404 TaxID=3155783 RepID=UPI0033DE4E28
MSEGIFIRLLGAVAAELRGEGTAQPIDIGPPRQRALLAMLATAGAHPVPMDNLVSGLWEDPPRNAEQSVYTYIAGLRRAFEPGRGRREPSRLLTGSPAGYVLRVEPAQVDALLFADWLEEARRLQRADDDAQAVNRLDRALAMWRGTGLSGLHGPFADRERARLETLMLAAREQRAESLLRMGRHREIVEELHHLTHQYPLHERTRELLMKALHRSGRPAEALAVFEEGRVVLAEELGVSPGEGLRRCHEMVLRADTDSASGSGSGSGPVRPHQLPRPLTGFVGRSPELIRLKELLAPWDDTPPHPLVIVTGPAGVGKSTLAAQAADAAKEHFPDGQLFVNCHGATPDVPALTALDVLGRFLRGLGVLPESVPADVDEAAAMWRTRLHGRRVLTLLDDAADLSQIRPLLATPLGSTLLVTSRETMAWGEDAVQVGLGRMSHAESATMLAGLVGAGRVSADTDQTTRLIGLCEGLPLALRIAGARLAGRPGWSVSAMAARLSDERSRLHELAAGDLAVRSSLSASHTMLERGSRPVDRLAARTLSLLGLLHVPEVTAEATAALLGMPVPEAERALERLADAHLLDHATHDRYRLHDLVRLFAGELRPEGAREALIRALSYYAASTRLAGHVAEPPRMVMTKPVDAVPHQVTTGEEARAWLFQEENVLTAAAIQALGSPDDTVARLGVSIAFSLFWHQDRSQRMVEIKKLNTMVLAVSERLGDERNAAIAHGYIATALRAMGRIDDAIGHLQAELAIARRTGDVVDEMRTLGNLSAMHNSGLRPEEALPWAERQLALSKQIESQVGIRYALICIGDSHLSAGRPREALPPLYEALANARKAEDAGFEGETLEFLGEAYLFLDDPREALSYLHEAYEVLTRTGYRLRLQICLIAMSAAYRALGELDQALSRITEAALNGGGLGNVRWERRLREEQEAVRAAREAASASNEG